MWPRVFRRSNVGLVYRRSLDTFHWAPLIYTDRAMSPRLLQICTRPSPTTMLTWIRLWWWHKYVTSIKQIIFERGWEVDNPLVSLLSAGLPSDDDKVLQCMWYWWHVNENSLKYKIENLYEHLFTISQTFMEIVIQFVGKWYWTSTWHTWTHDKQYLNLNLSYKNSQVLRYWISLVGCYIVQKALTWRSLCNLQWLKMKSFPFQVMHFKMSPAICHLM